MGFRNIKRKEYEKKAARGFLRLFLQKFLHICARFTIVIPLRMFIYRLMGVKIGRNVFIGMDSWLDDQFPELIRIENDVTISFRAMIITHDDAYEKTVAPVLIRKRAYIGAGAIILPGVVIGENAIVGAGSVVAKDVPVNSVAVGNPIRIIKKS